MTRGINVFLFPAGEGESWRSFQQQFRYRATTGMIRRYYHEGSAESLELHLSAPLECCTCHVCGGGQRRGFMWSGDVLTMTPQEFNERNPVEVRVSQHGWNPLVKPRPELRVGQRHDR